MRCSFAALTILTLATLVSAQETRRPAAFSDQELTRAGAEIQGLFKDDLAKAEKDPGVRQRLAVTLLQEAKDTDDQPPARFVLYHLARDLAARSGDAPVALQAIEELGQDFALPTAKLLQMKVDALAAAAQHSNSPAATHAVIDSSLALLEDTLAQDDFPRSLQLLAVADEAGRKLRNVPLVWNLRKRQEEVRGLQKEFARWQPFADRLTKDPSDAEANLEMGKYQAFLKANWELGLPLLVKSGSAQLRDMAKLELTGPRDPKQQANLGMFWWGQATDLTGPQKTNVLLHAYDWLQQANADSPSPALQERMKAIMEQLPPEYHIGEISGELRVWDAHQGPVYGVAISPDGKKVVSGGGDSSLRVFDARSGKELRRLDGHNGRIWTVAFAPDGRRVLSGGFDNSIRLWDLISGREVRRFPGHTDYVRSVVLSRDGKLALSGGDDRLVRLWNVDTGKELKTLKGHNHFVWSVALARDGKHALSGGLDKTVRYWDLETGKEKLTLQGHKDTVLAVAFSPDGRRAVSAGTDRTLILWDLETGQSLHTLTGHKGYVHSVAFSPDGRRILSAGQDNTVRLWDAQQGSLVRTLTGHRDQVWQVTFSRDGRLALSCGQDASVRVWGGTK